MCAMAKRISQRSGRKNNNERIRELIALLGSLSSMGDSVSLDAISKRLGITLVEAKDLMNIVCQASTDEFCGLLISSNDEETEFVLQYPAITGKPLRLTDAETIALSHALDAVGIDEDDPLRLKLTAAFLCDEVDSRMVQSALGTKQHAQDALYICAQAKSQDCELSFDYKGLKDPHPRRRRVRVQRLRTEANVWYADAYDVALQQERTFRIDRMSSLSLEQAEHTEQPTQQETENRFGIVFTDPRYYYAFDWPNMNVLRITDTTIHGNIAYYGERSTWLIRRICAGNGCIIVEDECIMKRARNYAQEVLVNSVLTTTEQS